MIKEINELDEQKLNINNSIPACVQKLFWDVKKETVDINLHSGFIIRRVLDFGDAVSLNWLRKTYSEETIKHIVKTERGLAHKTIVFWFRYYNLESGDMNV